MSEDSFISTTKPPCSREDALAVLMRLRGAGHVAYFAGGCVRDLLMGAEPKDWDVATDAPPGRVRGLFSNTQAVGAAFGVILVKQGRSTVEVATFRTEGIYSDGRRPDAVAFTDAEHDARRRDFTINGLFLDPAEKREARSEKREEEGGTRVETEHGVVIDYVGGVADLKNRVLRAIGDAQRRFAEDHLRLLRAVRFAARFGLAVERETERAIVENATKLRGISPERVADELRLMLTPATRERAWGMLWEYGLIGVIFRFLPLEPERAEFLRERSLFLRVAPGRGISFGLALAAGVLEYRMASGRDVLELVTRQEILKCERAMREGLKLSNDELGAMVGIVEPLGVLLAEAEPGVAGMKRFLALGTAGETRVLLAALAGLGMFVERVKWLEGRFGELLTGEVAPTPLITGDDLVAAGFVPGPKFKKVLEGIYDAQLEGRVGTKEEALRMAREMA
jgi:poly(A) polymerase